MDGFFECSRDAETQNNRSVWASWGGLENRVVIAVVAYFEGETIQAWSSKMIVVGKYKDVPTAIDKG